MGKRSQRSNKGSNKGFNKGSTQAEKHKDMDAKILKVMLMYHADHKFDVKVEDVAGELDVHSRNKIFRDRWSFLKNSKKFIGKSKSGDGLELTKAGLDEAATPEYKEMMKELAITPTTNKEHQECIKKYLKQRKSVEIFEFLHKYGTLSKDELAALVGQNPRSHGFFYSFNELRDKAYLEPHPDFSGRTKKRFRLTDKAFKSKDDRPKRTDVDISVLEDQISKGYAKIESQKTRRKSNENTTEKKEDPVNTEQQVAGENKEVKPDEENGVDIVPVVSTDCDSDAL